MTFDEYQKQAAITARYPEPDDSLVPPGLYCALGLNGEAGEVAEKIKKCWRDRGGFIATRTALTKELGDVLWYLSELARCWDIKLEEIAKTNLEKLANRAERGAIGGSGDDR